MDNSNDTVTTTWPTDDICYLGLWL